MQQMYSCPNCGAPVAYGQPQCTSCQTVFNWQLPPTQDQYQSSQYQYPDQQQQWYQASPDYQPAGWGSQGQDQLQNGGEKPKLSQLITGLRQRITGLGQTIKSNGGIIAKVSIILVILAALIGAGIALQGQISKWTAAPAVAAFNASSPTIIEGQEAILQWDATGVSSVSISPDIGVVSARGTRTVSPGATTTYTLVAGNLFGSVRKSITLTVTGKLPSINSFTINTDSIFAGQTAILSWNVTDATSVSIDPGIGAVSSSGTKNVSPGSTTNYMLTASNSAGNSTSSATLKVTASNTPIITTFSAGPASINSGESTTLIWDVIGAKSINISQGIGGVASKGSTKVTPVATTTYTLTAGSEYSSVTRSVTVTVNTTSTTIAENTTSPPAISTFSVNRNSIMLGDNITLTWAVTRARTVSISPDVGAVPASGWTTVIPIANTTYTLSAVNTFGTIKAEATVTVNKSTEGEAPVIKSFTAAPSSIPAGGTASLSWDIKGATLLFIDQGIGIPASKYSQQVSPAQTTTYVLTAINSTGTDNATVTLTVVP